MAIFKRDDHQSKLDRNAQYRIAALHNAVLRANEDGGNEGKPVDVFGYAESYYAWLQGKINTDRPKEEKEKQGKK